MEQVGNMFDTIIGIFQNFWYAILDFLPGSPLRGFINAIGNIPYLAELNWFFPVSEVITVLELWLVAVALFYTYSAIMRFIRIIG